MAKYRFTGLAHPDELADGHILTFGDHVKLNEDEVKANKRLIDAGLLLAVDSPDRKPRRKDREDNT